MDGRELTRGIDLFNQGRFFDAHEALEDVWRAAPAEEKKFLQGVVQIAVAFHHHSTGNRVGMRSVLERAMRNVAGNPQGPHDIQVARLLESLGQWRQALDADQPLPALPRIEWSDAKA